MADFVYIDTDGGLRDAVSHCLGREIITVDTEFQRTDTYYPEVGLIQLYSGDTCFLIDPLPLGSLRPLSDLLADTRTVKVLHACSEDLEVFEYAAGQVPSPVFDTQVAAAVLGTGFSMSYQNLVEHHLSITIPKEQTRSDWLRRPLTEAQLDYAALDVIHLYDVFQEQAQHLSDTGRADWVNEECALMTEALAINVDPFAVFQRIRSAARMSPQELNRLRELGAWREEIARRQNVPRNRIVDEKSLVNLARTPPFSREGLSRAGLSPRQVRKYSEEIFDGLDRAEQRPQEEWPDLLPESENVSNALLKTLRKIVVERAEKLNIAPEMLARRRQLEELLRSGSDTGGYELPASLAGWRKALIGDPLLDALEGG